MDTSDKAMSNLDEDTVGKIAHVIIGCVLSGEEMLVCPYFLKEFLCQRLHIYRNDK